MAHSAKYQIHFGLSGCYLPESEYGIVDCETRGALADVIRDAIAMYGLPKSLFNQVRIRALWYFIKRHGSSSAHFTLHHKGYCLSFSGLTDEEFRQASQDE